MLFPSPSLTPPTCGPAALPPQKKDHLSETDLVHSGRAVADLEVQGLRAEAAELRGAERRQEAAVVWRLRKGPPGRASALKCAVSFKEELCDIDIDCDQWSRTGHWPCTCIDHTITC
jgi:hypothetical protein